MDFDINDVRDIAKLLGTLRLKAKGDFRVAADILDEVLKRVHQLAREHRISIQIVSPSGDRIVQFTATGILVGAAAGLYLGNIPGALLGAAAGAVAGHFAAHLTLVMDRRDTSDWSFFKIA